MVELVREQLHEQPVPVGCTNTIPLQITCFYDAAEFLHPTGSKSSRLATKGQRDGDRRINPIAVHRHLIPTTQPKGGNMLSNDLDTQRLLTREHTERLAQEARNEWLARDLRETKRTRRRPRRRLSLPAALALGARRRSPEAEMGA